MTDVAVLGAWHLGSVTAACLAEAGHSVRVWDRDDERRAALHESRAPLHEPGLDELIAQTTRAGSLRVADDLAEAVAGAEVVWVTQDTHVRPDDRVDLSDLDALVEDLSAVLAPGTHLVVSSQVPVGTCDRWWAALTAAGARPAGIAYVPENLRLGAALARFRRPDMVVVGADSADTAAAVTDLLAFTSAPVLHADLRTGELVKHAINTFLATSISFANELAGVAELVGADATVVAQALRLDERIGPKARVGPGLGFAGGTLARDVTTLIDLGRAGGRPSLLAEAVLAVNERHASWPLERLRAALSLTEATVAVLGLTYTVGTSTLRRAQSVPLVRALAAAGATVRVHDPAADLTELTDALPATRLDDVVDAVRDCDAVVVLTPWPDYLALDWSRVAGAMRGRLVLDGPNALDPDALSQTGLVVAGPGRPPRRRTEEQS